MMFTTSRKVTASSAPTAVNRCSTHFEPSTPWNTRVKTVAPIRMKITMTVTFIVSFMPP